MFDLGKSLITMSPDEQKVSLDKAAAAQRNALFKVAESGGNRDQRQDREPQQREPYHDLSRLNTIVERENEAHDFFGKRLAEWQKGVAGADPSRESKALERQFTDYESAVLSEFPVGGRRHTTLAASLPTIRKDFLAQGQRHVRDKLNERSRSVLEQGLRRIALGAIKAKDGDAVLGFDDRAFELINQYVLSEADFEAKDASAMYDKYLAYTGFVPGQAASSASGQPAASAAITGMSPEQSADRNEARAPSADSSTQHAREMEARAASDKQIDSANAAQLLKEWEGRSGVSPRDVENHSRQKPGKQPTWINDELGKTEYYERRATDFEERNPGRKAPDYYREYGDKYAKRFDALKPELSEQGQQWLEKTKDILQFKMESGLRSGEWDESNPEDLKRKAYDSHSEAYLEAGLADLPQEDIDKVIKAVDRMDMVDPKALKESLEVEAAMINQKKYKKAWDTALTGFGHLVPTIKELGEASKTVFEALPALSPAKED